MGQVVEWGEDRKIWLSFKCWNQLNTRTERTVCLRTWGRMMKLVVIGRSAAIITCCLTPSETPIRRTFGTLPESLTIVDQQSADEPKLSVNPDSLTAGMKPSPHGPG